MNNTQPILFYRKLKENPKVFILDLQSSATLDLTNRQAFVGITSYGCTYPPVYFGFLETTTMTAASATRCELELGRDCFADDKQYTKKEVDDILHPILYFDFK